MLADEARVLEAEALRGRDLSAGSPRNVPGQGHGGSQRDLQDSAEPFNMKSAPSPGRRSRRGGS